MAVGERIKRARNFRGMTQKELGVAIGFEAQISVLLNMKVTPELLKRNYFAKLQLYWT